MKILDELQALPENSGPRVLTIGAYDGVHRGHQAILSGAVRRARRIDGCAIALTFDPHPQRVVSPGDAPSLLQTAQQKSSMLDACGVDYTIVLAFSRELSLLSPSRFISDVLMPRQPEEVHVGWNFRFGHRRSGSLDELRLLGERFGFGVVGVPPVALRGTPISSSRIRRAIAEGRVELAARMLGRPYEIGGVVVRGDRRGGTIGFPTLNLDTPNDALPTPGVYAGRVTVSSQTLPAAINVGYRPTVEWRRRHPLVEAHILSFQGDLYGRSVALEFCFRLRAERRFSGLDALKDQISKDVERTRRYFERTRRKAPAGPRS